MSKNYQTRSLMHLKCSSSLPITCRNARHFHLPGTHSTWLPDLCNRAWIGKPLVRRTISKSITLAVAIIAGVHAIGSFSVLFSSHFFEGLISLLISGAIAWFAWRRYQSFRRYQAQTYDWYISAHPVRSGSGNRPECLKCGSTYVQARRLMLHTFTVEHSCGTCGTPLYFSEER